MATLHRLASAPDLVDQAYRTLVDAISSGALAPGERIVQEALAEQLAVSRQPVLQALRLLKADGLVQDAPGRGLRVTPLDAGLIAQVYAVRGALDGLAARLAAGRRTAPVDAVMQRPLKETPGRVPDFPTTGFPYKRKGHAWRALSRITHMMRDIPTLHRAA
ncbi:MAG: GntR family transcriptional regulator [Rhodoferax sp.]|nr:GntR family transcriptional regulator [Rhodoferax sp.]